MRGVCVTPRVASATAAWFGITASLCSAQCLPGHWATGRGLSGLQWGTDTLAAWDQDGPGGSRPTLVIANSAFAGNVLSPGAVGYESGMWQSMPTDGITDRLYSFGVFQDNLYAGGEVYPPGQASQRHVLRWTGTNWISIGLIGGGYATSLTPIAGGLVAGGQFQSIGGVAAQNLAKWNGLTWQPVGTTIGRVDAVTEYQGALVVGSESGIYKWTGSWQRVPSTANSSILRGVFRDLLAADNSLYVTGDFYAVDNLGPAYRFHNVAVFRGTDWEQMTSGLQGQGGQPTLGEGTTLARVGSDIVVGGYFDTAGGEPAQNVARWDGVAWHPMDNGLDGIVRSSVVLDGELFVGGGWSPSDSGSMNVARWDGTSWASLSDASDGWITCSTFGDGVTYVGGQFKHLDGLPASHVARQVNGAWEPLGAGTDFISLFSGMTLHNGQLFVSASVPNTAGTAILRWDGSNWTPVATGISGSVNSLLSYNHQLVAGGNFSELNGMPILNIARWDGMQWSAMGVSHGNVRALLVHNGTLHAAGYFGPPPSDVGDRGTVAAWIGEEWHPLALAPGNSPGNSYFECLASYHGELLAAGMNWRDGVFLPSVWRWTGSDWEAVQGSPSGRTISMSVFADQLFIVGQYGGYCWYNLCETTSRVWNGVSWSELNVRGNIYTTSSTDTGVFLGGEVLQADSVVSGPWAEWRPGGVCCDSIDFNHDMLFPDTGDIEDFVSVFSGGTCAPPNAPACNSDIDFNNDHIAPDLEDVYALIQVFAGGPCE